MKSFSSIGRRLVRERLRARRTNPEDKQGLHRLFGRKIQLATVIDGYFHKLRVDTRFSSLNPQVNALSISWLLSPSRNNR